MAKTRGCGPSAESVRCVPLAARAVPQVSECARERAGTRPGGSGAAAGRRMRTPTARRRAPMQMREQRRRELIVRSARDKCGAGARVPTADRLLFAGFRGLGRFFEWNVVFLLLARSG